MCNVPSNFSYRNHFFMKSTISYTATETEEAKALMDWVQTQPLLRKYLIHIPNEGKRSWWLGKQYKHLGLKSGVSDYFLPIPVPPYHGCWIELKRTKMYRINLAQKEWIDSMLKMGYSAHFAFGAEEAIKILCDYLNLSKLQLLA